MNKFIKDMPSEEYHAHPAISNSQLSLFAKDENLLAWSIECPQDKEKMKALDFGTAMHAICLEPDKLKSEYIQMPDVNLRTNAGKAEKAEFYEANSSKKILTADEYKKLNLMYESIMAHPAARQIIEADGIAEGSFFFDDYDTGVSCRVRPDKVMVKDGYAADIKTTEDLSKFKFSVEDYRYFVQDPFYCDGLAHNGIETSEMRFLVVQKTIELGRYPCMVVTLPQDVVDYGRKTYKEDLVRYAEYKDNPYIKPSNELEMHHWFINKIYDEQIQDIT